jgi:hypothetical protein
MRFCNQYTQAAGKVPPRLCATALKLGNLELKVQETKTVNVPLILSAGSVVLGMLLVAWRRK